VLGLRADFGRWGVLALQLSGESCSG